MAKWSCIFLVCLSVQAFGQIDTTYTHNRNLAALFSTVVPGSGQIYNEIGHRKVQGRKHISWWRAPLYLSGMAVTGYYGFQNYNLARKYKKEWLYRTNNDGFYFHEELKDSTDNFLISEFQQRAKYRDYAITGLFLVYGLNIIDAYIDAHFVTFDISKDLSMHFEPRLYPTNDYGLAMVLNFK